MTSPRDGSTWITWPWMPMALKVPLSLVHHW
jgi:hypothetical protein